jgi:hypothetical protein
MYGKPYVKERFMKRSIGKSPAALDRLASLIGTAALVAAISFGLAGCNLTTTTKEEGKSKNSAVNLTLDTWAEGAISSSSSNNEQWFKFTATAAIQYIHIKYGTLTDLYVQLYDSTSTPLGDGVRFDGMSNTIEYIDRTVTSGQMYYIRVTPYYSSDSGSYKIAFNTSGVVSE